MEILVLGRIEAPSRSSTTASTRCASWRRCCAGKRVRNRTSSCVAVEDKGRWPMVVVAPRTRSRSKASDKPALIAIGAGDVACRLNVEGTDHGHQDFQSSYAGHPHGPPSERPSVLRRQDKRPGARPHSHPSGRRHRLAQSGQCRKAALTLKQATSGAGLSALGAAGDITDRARRPRPAAPHAWPSTPLIGLSRRDVASAAAKSLLKAVARHPEKGGRPRTYARYLKELGAGGEGPVSALAVPSPRTGALPIRPGRTTRCTRA
jgi:hypothetical protein